MKTRTFFNASAMIRPGALISTMGSDGLKKYKVLKVRGCECIVRQAYWFDVWWNWTKRKGIGLFDAPLRWEAHIESVFERIFDELVGK